MNDENLREWVEEFNHWKAVAESKQALRDHFAAAALTGLLDKSDAVTNPAVWWPEMACAAAYRWADAMLRERERTNHDAAPAARAVSTDDRTDKAAPSQCMDRPGDTPVTEPMPKEKRAEVSYAEPVAWAVVSDSKEEIDCEFIYPDEATAIDVAMDSNGGVVPLYRNPRPTLTDAEREAISYAAGALDHLPWYQQKLRGLLERTE